MPDLFTTISLNPATTSASMSRSLRPLLINSIRAAVSVGILYMIVRKIDVAQVLPLLSHTHFSLLLLALLMQAASTTLAAYRWHLVMHNLQMHMPWVFYCRSYFKGMFFNQALPTSIGGDAVKIIDLVRAQFRKRDAFYGVVVDRLLGLGGLLLLCLISCVIGKTALPDWVYQTIVSLNLGGLLGFFALMYCYTLPFLKRLPALRQRLYDVSVRLKNTFSAQRGMIFLTSLLIPACALLGFAFTGWALGLTVDLSSYFILIPPAIVFTVLPISIAGWGVREGALVTLFATIGADSTLVLMMSLLYGLSLILVSLPGLVLFVLEGSSRFKAMSRPPSTHS